MITGSSGLPTMLPYCRSSADAWDSSSAGETAMSMASHFLSCARISSHHAWPPLSRSSTQT